MFPTIIVGHIERGGHRRSETQVLKWSLVGQGKRVLAMTCANLEVLGPNVGPSFFRLRTSVSNSSWKWRF